MDLFRAMGSTGGPGDTRINSEFLSGKQNTEDKRINVVSILDKVNCLYRQ